MRFVTVLVMGVALTTPATSQTFTSETASLAGRISATLTAKGFRAVATMTFTDLQGRPTELGCLVAERLSIEIVSSSGVAMVDRANISRILAEHRLSEEGLVRPENAKKLGDFAGVDAFLRGTVTTLDEMVILSVTALSTDSARLVAAGGATFPVTRDLLQLSNRTVSGCAATGAGLRAPNSPESSGASYREDPLIAVKDYGTLRVALKSVVRTGRASGNTAGVRAVIEVTNLDTRSPLVLAVNAESLLRQGLWNHESALRSSVVDDRGGVWALKALQGMSIIRPGVRGRDGLEAYAATDTPRLLLLRDRLGRDTDDPSDTFDCRISGFCGYTPPGQPPQYLIPHTGNRFVSGETTSVEPGQSISVILDFQANTQQAAMPPGAVQFSCEVVIGTVGRDGKISYSLRNVVFDRITVP